MRMCNSLSLAVLVIVIVFTALPCMLLAGSDDQSQADSSLGDMYWDMSDGVKLHFFAEGDGKIALLIHGGPGYPFEKPLPGLESLLDRYQFVYYHQRGCGQSTRPVDKFTSSNFMQNAGEATRKLGLGRQLQDINEIRRILGEEKLTIIGHSFGGFIAAMYAKDYPDHVRGLVLAAPANMLVFPIEGESMYDQVKAYLPDSMKADFDDYTRRLFDFRDIFTKTDSELSVLNAEFVDYYKIAAEKKGFPIDIGFDKSAIGGWMTHGMYFSMGMQYDHRPALEEVTVPVLVLHGDQDFQTEAASRTYVEVFPNASFKLIEGAGHFIYKDSPGEFAKAVEAFLDSLDW